MIRIHIPFKDHLHWTLTTFDSSISPSVFQPDIRSLYSFFTARAALSVPRGHFTKFKYRNILSVKWNECLSAPFRAARGVKNEYTHCGSTMYRLGVLNKMTFLWIGIGDGF